MRLPAILGAVALAAAPAFGAPPAKPAPAKPAAEQPKGPRPLVLPVGAKGYEAQRLSQQHYTKYVYGKQPAEKETPKDAPKEATKSAPTDKANDTKVDNSFLTRAMKYLRLS